MLIVGCGAVGRRVVTQTVGHHQPVIGIVRSSESAAMCAEHNITVMIVDLDAAPLPPIPSLGAKVFYFAPPPTNGGTDTRMTGFLTACARDGEPERIVAISTTGVYGDCAGAWVDEARTPNPTTDRARRRWDAEQQLRNWRERTGGELVILRVAGIYGPGKLPLQRLRQGLPMIPENEAPWTNRIHIDDLATVCSAAMNRGRDGAVYNVSDGAPGNMADYFNQVADRAGLPRPPVVSRSGARAKLSAGLLSYLAESRRLNNRKMLAELGVTLRYPSLTSGLDSCFATSPHSA